MKSKINKIYSKRTQIDTYDLSKPPPSKSLIDDLLRITHKLVPSKQRFMPYKIHVLGPDKILEKEELYRLTTHTPNNGLGKASYHNKGAMAHYVLIFTMRLCDDSSPSIQMRMKKGHSFGQCDPGRYKNEKDTVCIEVGMFASILTGLCIENNLDVCFIKCYAGFNEEEKPWKELKFVDDEVLLLMGIGYRHPDDNRKYADTEFKPEYTEVIKWLN